MTAAGKQGNNGPNVTNLIKWLKKMPQPVAVVVDDRRIEVPRVHSPWKELAQSILALDPEKIVALNANGEILRAVEYDDETDPATPAQSSALPDLQVFAKLLADAYERGSSAQAKAYASIFEENTKLVRLLADRLGALEMAWQRALQSHARLVTEVAEANARAAEAEAAAAAGGGDDSILGALAAGIASAQGLPTQAQPNGGGKRGK